MQMFKRFLLLAVVATVSACSSMDDQPMRMASAHKFSDAVASSDRYEIASSKLALSRSHNPRVRMIAERMIADHNKTSNELMAIDSADNIPMPPPKGMMPMQREMLDRLAASKGRDFNREYLQQQGMAHRQAIAMFRDYAEHGDNADLRAFARRNLPTLEEHYDMITRTREEARPVRGS